MTETTPEPVHAPDSPTGVRQGKAMGVMRYVLSVSLALAIAALVIGYLVA